MNSTQSVAEFRQLLEETDERASTSARIRPLLPHIDHLIRTGLSRSDIRGDLRDAGLPVSQALFDKALYRWRKAQRLAGSSLALANTSRQSPQPPIPLDATKRVNTSEKPGETSAVQGRPGRIETPGDLRKIRDMKIDLDALRREGEDRRKTQK